MGVEWEAVIDADCPVPIAWRHTRRYWLSRIRDEIGRVEKERDNARAAIDAANARATDAERRLALAVAEVRAARVLLWPGGGYTLAKPDGEGRDDCQRYEDARIATDADPVLAKMIGGGE